ncbi:MAG: response regulator [Desulfomonile tiedjei]|nr:response regulator [Desulfomonile tiedjei]
MKKILIVDDLEEVRDLVEATLSRGEYEILKGETGTQAIEIAQAQKPDLILMDIMMPGPVDGLEATRTIKRDPTTRDCTIILLTAKGQSTDRREGLQAGADEYFAKPFSPLELLKKVEQVLG